MASAPTPSPVPSIPDVIVAGAGPTGLMLAAELRLAGARVLVLERRPELRETARANGVGGHILDLLHFRGLLGQIEAASADPVHPAPIFPFGDVHVDFSQLAEQPLRGVRLPQPALERLLAELATERGAEIRRGEEIVGASQTGDRVTADVRRTDGAIWRVEARYLVGCDGVHSRVREAAGIAFPGTTYPDVIRLGQVTLADSAARLAGGDLDVAGVGRVSPGFTHTDRGVFAVGSLTEDVLMIQTTEAADVAVDDDSPMDLAEFQASIGRVLGGEIPLATANRLSRYQWHARQADRYREGRILLAGDASHQFPSSGIGLGHGMLDAVNLAWKLGAEIQGWAPDDLLESYHDERHYAGERGLLQTQAQVALRRGQDDAGQALRTVFLELLRDDQPLARLGGLISGSSLRYPLRNTNGHDLTGRFAPNLALRTSKGPATVAELLHEARPVLVDLADRADLQCAAEAWSGRIDIHTAETDDRPADALLIRPDGHVAWAATVGEPVDDAVQGLRDALATWCGEPTVLPQEG